MSCLFVSSPCLSCFVLKLLVRVVTPTLPPVCQLSHFVVGFLSLEGGDCYRGSWDPVVDSGPVSTSFVCVASYSLAVLVTKSPLAKGHQLSKDKKK